LPTPLELPEDVRKIDGRWLRNCPECGLEISHLRRNYCVHASLSKQPCKRCSNTNNHPGGMAGPVRVAWYNSFMKSAITRGYSWEITIEDIATLHELQGGRCALTGWPIGWSTQKWDHTASIDRIDNSVGYTLENIQLVHKSVNMARGTMSVAEFIEMCIAISDKVKW
jgi:hypothetical protein